jgi:HlyD family secretion protein
MSDQAGKKKWYILGGALLLGAFAAAPLLRHQDSVQYLSTKVLKGQIRDAVDATGTVNAVVNVQVGSQVSGTVAKLNADFNSQVHKGDVIAEIDPRLLEGALLQATADLENAKANVVSSQANSNKSRAALVQTKADFDRARVLASDSVGSQQALDLAKANFDAAKAGVEAAVAAVAQAQADVKRKEAAVTIARTNLNYTIIRSPIDGTVVARNVDVGQTVAASLQAPTIFTIAQDLSKMLVYAKVDESDVGRIRTGQPVSFKVDAFPKQQFHGAVDQIRMNPTSVQNVVTYDAVIAFDNPERKLFPGMTAYVTIPVATADNVVKLPNAALRFKPPLSPEEVRAVYAKYGISVDDAPDTGTAAPSAKQLARAERTIIWKHLANGTVEPVQVALGITDHAYTELTGVVTGDVQPGDEVVTSAITTKSQGPVQGMRR